MPASTSSRRWRLTRGWLWPITCAISVTVSSARPKRATNRSRVGSATARSAATRASKPSDCCHAKGNCSAMSARLAYKYQDIYISTRARSALAAEDSAPGLRDRRPAAFGIGFDALSRALELQVLGATNQRLDVE